MAFAPLALKVPSVSFDDEVVIKSYQNFGTTSNKSDLRFNRTCIPTIHPLPLLQPSNEQQMKILIIGAGNMGTTFGASFLRSIIITSDNLYFMDHLPEKADGIQQLSAHPLYA